MKKSLILGMIIFCNYWVGFAANEPLATKPIRPDFDSITTVFQKIQDYQQLEITLNFDSLILGKRSNDEHPAQLIFKGEKQETFTINSKVRPRGRYRRSRCELPPIRLNFEKTELESLNLFAKYDKLKLVTHCNQSDINGSALLKEYWMYKMYNEVSDSSFRVHLLEITYIDAADATNRMESYAIIIENTKEMAHRLNGEIVEQQLGHTSTALLPDAYHNFMLFNFMIGNNDWKLTTQKNLKLVKHANTDLYSIIPYDFDFANMVQFSKTNANLNLISFAKEHQVVKDPFLNKNSLDKTLNKFNALKKTGLTCFKACPELKKIDKIRLNDHLKSFFRATKNKKAMHQLFLAQS